MQDSENLLATLEALPIPVAVIRREDALIRFANRNLAETMRVPPGSLTGLQSLRFYVEPTRRQELLAAIERDGRVADFELAVIRGDGSFAHLALWVEPVTFQGEACNLVSAIDISARRSAELLLNARQRVLQRLVALTERDRQLVSYELHDGIVQDMTAAVMFLEAARAELAGGNADLGETLEATEKLLRGALQEARRLIDGLQPPDLDQGDVLTAIQQLVQTVQQRSGIEVRLQSELADRRFVPALERAVYRIVQEALHNAERHSQADSVEIAFTLRGDTAVVTIADDGCGFDVASVSGKRYGLVGIRERARLLGGRATIDSSVGHGTRIVVELPVVDTLTSADAEAPPKP
ncbi:MAG: histidine kinase [Pirellulales bacterium]